MLRWSPLPDHTAENLLMLSFIGHCIEAELHRLFGATGSITLHGREPWEAIARLGGADAGGRRILRNTLPELFTSGLLMQEGDTLRLTRRAVLEAQPEPIQERTENHRRANGAPTDHEKDRKCADPGLRDSGPWSNPSDVNPNEASTDATGARPEHEDRPNHAKSHSRAEIRKEEIRKEIPEFIPPNPPTGGTGLKNSGPSGEVDPAVRAPPTAPTPGAITAPLVAAPPAVEASAGAAPAVEHNAAPGGQRRRRRASTAGGGDAAPPAERRAAKGPTDSQRRYARSYAAGISKATGNPFPPPLDPRHRIEFRSALPTYAVDGAGHPLTGDELDAWIEQSAEGYARMTAHQAHLEHGFSVMRWASWLAAGGPKATPAGRVGFYGDAVLRIWGDVYARSRRNYGTYVARDGDAREAHALAIEVAGIAEQRAEQRRVDPSIPLAKITSNNKASVEPEEVDALKIAAFICEFFGMQYLRMDGYDGGKQFVDEQHPLRNLRRNIRNFGRPWEMKDPKAAAQTSTRRPQHGAKPRVQGDPTGYYEALAREHVPEKPIRDEGKF
jgi:hypothetical protein